MGGEEQLDQRILQSDFVEFCTVPWTEVLSMVFKSSETGPILIIRVMKMYQERVLFSASLCIMLSYNPLAHICLALR